MPQSVLTLSARSAVVGALVWWISASTPLAEQLTSQPPPARRALKNVVSNAMEEASHRFHVPVTWLRAVMRAESDGDAKSVSGKGAIGHMQVMPATYDDELRVKHGLGADPFDPHDNILAGQPISPKCSAATDRAAFLLPTTPARVATRSICTAGRCHPRPSITSRAWRGSSASRA